MGEDGAGETTVGAQTMTKAARMGASLLWFTSMFLTGVCVGARAYNAGFWLNLAAAVLGGLVILGWVAELDKWTPNE